MRLFSNCLAFQQIFGIADVVVAAPGIVAAGNVAAAAVAIEPRHLLALGSVEYVAAAAVVANSDAVAVGIRADAERLSVQIGRLCDLAARLRTVAVVFAAVVVAVAVVAVAGMPTLMCSLRVKVAPNR